MPILSVKAAAQRPIQSICAEILQLFSAMRC